MAEERNRAALDAHWKASADGDADAEHAIYAEDAICEYPQSGERILGRANLQALRSHHPGKPSGFAVRRIVGSGDLWVTEYTIDYQGKAAFTVSIMEFREGRVIHETQYFADAFEAPAWRAQWVEQDPFQGRRPTSHEQMSGESWDASYTGDGPAPWDIGQPQPAIVRLAARVRLTGPVLDAGCGLGENTLHLASLGLAVVGVDVAETALAIARKAAAERGLKAEFVAGDAFHLERLGRTFATVVDSGLFHTFDAEEQVRYAAGLAAVTDAGGMVYVLCFGDGGADAGPHPVSQGEIRAAFSAAGGWVVVSIEAERVETIYHAGGVSGWLAAVRRAGQPGIRHA